jgi:pyridoxamine 5'-phosphate oxidase
MEGIMTRDPIQIFDKWLAEAEATGMTNPNAVLLSTVDERGRPSSRVMLLKGHDERGFVFYTNLESRKGRELAANAHVALLFYWRELGRQVRIEGPVEQVADQEADAYFASRARTSRLGAWASKQSQPLSNRAVLMARVAKFEAKHPLEVPRPPFWSGFRVVPETIELWREGKFRLHRRELFRKTEDGWDSGLLYP